MSRKQLPGSLELLVSPNGGRFDGLVLKDDRPFSGATVTLVPESDRRKEERLYKSTTTDQNAQFSVRGITPGDYKLFAWEASRSALIRTLSSCTLMKRGASRSTWTRVAG